MMKSEDPADVKAAMGDKYYLVPPEAGWVARGGGGGPVLGAGGRRHGAAQPLPVRRRACLLPLLAPARPLG
jgi:hypothetical protein